MNKDQMRLKNIFPLSSFRGWHFARTRNPERRASDFSFALLSNLEIYNSGFRALAESESRNDEPKGFALIAEFFTHWHSTHPAFPMPNAGQNPARSSDRSQILPPINTAL